MKTPRSGNRSGRKSRVQRPDLFFAVLGSVGVVLALMLCNSYALGGVNSWTSHGPEGGGVSALVIDPRNPSVLMAGTPAGGIFQSIDGAATWQGVGGLDAAMGTLQFDSASPPNLYWVGESLARSDVGLFVSHDFGRQWTIIGIPGTGRPNSLAIDPQAPSRLYASTAALCNETDCTGGGVYKSTDSGTNWVSSSNGLPGGGGTYSSMTLVIDPKTPSTVYALSFLGDRVYKSTDSGGTWVPSPDKVDGTLSGHLAIDARNPSTLYVGSWPFCWLTCIGGGIFKSSDGGNHWSRLEGLPYRQGKEALMNLLVVDATTSAVYVGGNAGVWKSTNAGASWALTGLSTTYPFTNALAIDPTSPSTVYAADANGIRKSLDGGKSWGAANRGIVSTEIWSVIGDPSISGRVYAAEPSRGLFRTDDGGASWSKTGLEGPMGGGARRVLIDSVSSQTIYALSDGGVFKSENAGSSWLRSDSGINAWVHVLAIDPLSPHTLYAVTETSLFKTVNGAASWDSIASGSFYNWIVVDPRTPGTLYASTASGILKSVDGGAGWTEFPGPADALSLVIDPEESSTLYVPWVSGAEGGLLKSTDGGASWVDASVGLPGGKPILGLIIDPKVHTTVYAVVQLGGVFRSVDGGKTWASLNAGLTNSNVSALTVDSSGTELHVGTIGSGVFDYQIGAPEPCAAGPTVLCLSNGRFRVEARWRVPSQGTSGSGTAVPLTPDTGYFWFFQASNVEMVVKVLDGCGINKRFWVFSGGLTNVEVTLTVTDTETGGVKTYINPSNTAFLPIQDTAAFATCPTGATASLSLVGAGAEYSAYLATHGRSYGGREASALVNAQNSSPCTADPAALCLSSGRFRVQADWRVPSQGTSGQGMAIALTADTGYFWFFQASNVEMIVKVLDGCGINRRFWVFAGGLTNVEVTLTVTDTQTGEVRIYVNPANTAFLPLQDTAAFAGCN